MAVASLQVTHCCVIAGRTRPCHSHLKTIFSNISSGQSFGHLQDREAKLQQRLADAGATDVAALQDEASQLRMENAMLKARGHAAGVHAA